MPSIKQHSLVLAVSAVLMCISIFSYAYFHKKDGHDAVSFLLTDQYGRKTTHEDLSEKPLLVFFGFTSCVDICPMSMYTLTAVLTELTPEGLDQALTPVFISVDPERDSVQQLASYLGKFNQPFVGLTGSRTALENVAAEFNTFLDSPPAHTSGLIHHSEYRGTNTHTGHAAIHHEEAHFIENYQLRHSSIVYLVDRNSRVVDFISLNEDIVDIVQRLRTYLTDQPSNHRPDHHDNDTVFIGPVTSSYVFPPP